MTDADMETARKVEALEKKLPPSTRSLARKVAEIMAAVSHVPKAGHNDHFNYSFAQEADVLAAVRGEMAKRHLALFPSVVAHQVREVAGKNGVLYVTTLRVEFTLEDGDSGETRSFCVMGEGQDNTDKGSNKALTAAEKYAALKLFMIPTGADPDADAPQEEVPRAASGQSRSTPAAPPRPAPQQQRPAGNLPTVFPPFGGLKGQPIKGAPAKDLKYYSDAARRSMADPSKARFHDKERANLAAYEAEIARQRVETVAGPGGPDDAMGDYGPPPPGDEDAPF